MGRDGYDVYIRRDFIVIALVLGGWDLFFGFYFEC